MLLLSIDSLPAFQARLEKLTPQSQRLWGALTVERMVRHLRFSADVSLEEVPDVPDVSNIFSRTVVPFFAFYVVPWPKGKIKAPDAITPPAEFPLEQERALLLEKMKRFTIEARNRPSHRARHPMFGLCTLAFWQRMHGKHFDHHLQQFGV